MHNDPVPYKDETLILDGGIHLPVPIFTSKDMPQCHCAKYARIAANRIFGKVYPIQPAWEMRNHARVVATLEANDELEHLVNSSTVVPGMLIGVYWEGSSFNQPERLYTHMSLYVGKKFGKPLFLEQFVDTITPASLQDYNESGFTIMDILDVR